MDLYFTFDQIADLLFVVEEHNQECHLDDCNLKTGVEATLQEAFDRLI